MVKEKNIYSNNRLSQLILLAFAVLLLITAVFAIRYISRHTFSAAKWRENEDDRKYMVADLLKKHPLIGMSEQDVINLLGAETSQQATFKGDYAYYSPEQTLVYYIGHDFLEGEWLILTLKDGVVDSIRFGLT